MALIHVWWGPLMLTDIIKRLHISGVLKRMQKVWDIAITNMSVPLSSITIRTPPPGALIASVLTYPPFGVCCKAVSRRWLHARRRLSASTAAYSGEHDVIWSFWPLWFASPFAACPNNRKTSATSHGLHPQEYKWINTSSSGIHKRLENSTSCTEYDKHYGPHYRVYFHAKDFGDNVMGAHHLHTHYILNQRSTLQVTGFLLAWK